MAALCWASGRSERVAEGSRGNEPQLRGVRGGIVWCGATSAGVCCGSRGSKSGYFLALEEGARDGGLLAALSTIPISLRWALPNTHNQLVSQYRRLCELVLWVKDSSLPDFHPYNSYRIFYLQHYVPPLYILHMTLRVFQHPLPRC